MKKTVPILGAVFLYSENWNLLDFYILNLDLEHDEMFHTDSSKSLL